MLIYVKVIGRAWYVACLAVLYRNEAPSLRSAKLPAGIIAVFGLQKGQWKGTPFRWLDLSYGHLGSVP
eukprot:m.222584 g.222584  ORF g.222584 m.222584 type:complete len:68 (-) comp17254_c0_seq14:952-1155(-)